MLTHELVGRAMQDAMNLGRLHGPALEQLQRERLNDLLQFAMEHSDFYRRHYAGIDLQQAALADLPPVDKAVIQQHFDDVVTDPRLKHEEVQQFCTMEGADGKSWHLDEFAGDAQQRHVGQPREFRHGRPPRWRPRWRWASAKPPPGTTRVHRGRAALLLPKAHRHSGLRP